MKEVTNLKKMSHQPEHQNQHFIPQVYLREFGYQIDDVWFVDVFDMHEGKQHQKEIRTFLSDINTFDLPYLPLNDRRHFENTSSKLETDFPKLLKVLHGQKRLNEKYREYLSHFSANVLFRQPSFRKLLTFLVNDPSTKEGFLKEISMFYDQNESDAEYLTRLYEIAAALQNNHNPKKLINLLSGHVMKHLITVFENFSATILQSPPAYNWFTTDNPVFLDLHEQLGYLVPVEAEVYFPLSKDYLVYMHHEGCTSIENRFKSFTPNRIHQLTFEEFEKVNKTFCEKGVEQFLIMPPYEESNT